MNRSNKKLSHSVVLVTVTLALLLPVTLPVQAQKPRPMDLDCAAQTVAKRTGGKILAAEEVETKNKRFFQIKVLTPNGRVRYIRIDPKQKCAL